MQQPRNYADPVKTVYIPAGILKFGIEYRHLQGDQGVCIHVFGEVNGREEEVLRFDCFERAPHYHYAWSTNDRYVPLDATAGDVNQSRCGGSRPYTGPARCRCRDPQNYGMG
jgi:hypothetical protein